MIKELEKINDATHKWVSEFNAIPQGMIGESMSFTEGSWTEVTTPCVGDRIYCYSEDVYGEVSEINEDIYIIEPDNGDENIETNIDDIGIEKDSCLPMWGTIWSFGDNLDNEWLSNHDGIKLMSECGFRIYEHDEYGYFFGIDGAGYDFYEAHWIPLYKKRGLKWHEYN